MSWLTNVDISLAIITDKAIQLKNNLLKNHAHFNILKKNSLQNLS